MCICFHTINLFLIRISLFFFIVCDFMFCIFINFSLTFKVYIFFIFNKNVFFLFVNSNGNQRLNPVLYVGRQFSSLKDCQLIITHFDEINGPNWNRQPFRYVEQQTTPANVLRKSRLAMLHHRLFGFFTDLVIFILVEYLLDDVTE